MMNANRSKVSRITVYVSLRSMKAISRVVVFKRTIFLNSDSNSQVHHFTPMIPKIFNYLAHKLMSC